MQEGYLVVTAKPCLIGSVKGSEGIRHQHLRAGEEPRPAPRPQAERAVHNLWAICRSCLYAVQQLCLRLAMRPRLW